MNFKDFTKFELFSWYKSLFKWYFKRTYWTYWI